MIEAYWGLKATPFHKSIAPDRLFTWPASQELQKRLQYMKTARGIMLVTGLPGVGKTTALRAFVSALPTTTFLPLYLTLSALTTHDFYRQLNQALGGEPRGRKCELYACLQHSVASTVARQQVPVVIFDEAHLLAHDVLHELQILANYQMDSVDPMLWVFLAQPHLRDRLSRVVFQSFHQRIALRYHLDPLDAEQTQAYVRHHLKVCGRSEPIFTEPAFAASHHSLQRRLEALYLDWPTYLQVLKEAFPEPQLPELFHRARDVPLLALDDLSVGRWSRWATEQFYLLIEYRLKHLRRTLLAALGPPHQLPSSFPDFLLSRLQTRFTLLKLPARDARRHPYPTQLPLLAKNNPQSAPQNQPNIPDPALLPTAFRKPQS